jgi:hypothetical protein
MSSTPGGTRPGRRSSRPADKRSRRRSYPQFAVRPGPDALHVRFIIDGELRTVPLGPSKGFRRGLDGEGPELVISLANHSVAGLGHLVPGARQVADRFGDH